MFHCIGDVHLIAAYAGIFQRAIEQLSRRSDKGVADAVFLIAGLLADQHDGRVRRPFAEYGLGCIRPQGAVPAVLRGFTHFLQGIGIGGYARCVLRRYTPDAFSDWLVDGRHRLRKQKKFTLL
jgi:hypothetical protein